jgi:tRNA (cmo5U34)-methyltransferase
VTPGAGGDAIMSRMSTDPAALAAVQTAGWSDPDQVAWYVQRVGVLPQRVAGEGVLAGVLPATAASVADLGCGDGRLTALVLDSCPGITRALATDRSEPMLALARERFGSDARVEVGHHDLEEPLAWEETFDVIVSGFAIHHLHDERKRALFSEIAQSLTPGGLFANLEVVASATPELHARFLAEVGRVADDPEDHLANIANQLQWLREAGLVQVDCLWRWRGFALLVGEAPT